MQSNENIRPNTLKIIQEDSLVKCRSTELGINETSLPKSYDADDAIKEGLTSEAIAKHVLPNLSSPLHPDKKEPESLTILALKCCNNLELFHDQENNAYCILAANDKSRVLQIPSGEFTLWLRKALYNSYEKSININSLNEVIATLEAKAIFEGNQREVYVRTAYINGSIFIDLCNENNQVIEISVSARQSHIADYFL